MQKIVKLICLFAIVIGGLCIGFGQRNIVSAENTFSENELVRSYYKRVTLQKDGTGTGNNSMTFSGLVPYGTGKISLGTYDMTESSNLTAPLFTILPQRDWKTTSTPTEDADNMFFNVNLTSGEKSITFRFARASGSNYTAVFVGNDGNYFAGNNNNVWLNSIEWPYTGLPYRYDGTVSSTSIYDENKTVIEKPLEIGLYYRSGEYGGEYYTDATGKNGAMNASVAKESAVGSGTYRYAITLASSFPKFTEDELKSIEVSIEFDKKTVAEEESWVMFTSIAGNTFDHNINYELWGGRMISVDYTRSYTFIDTQIPNLPKEIEKQNYTFSHWYYGTNPDNKVNEGDFSAWLAQQTGDITLKAYYIPEEFSVYYDLNYEDATVMEADKINYINYYGFNLKAVPFENYPTGMIFEGWYTQKEGGEKVTEIIALKEQTFYAHWKSGNVVTFDYGNDKQVKTAVEAEGKVEEPTIPEKKGYTFQGWFCNGKLYDFNETVSSPLTITAVYSPNVYSVIFYIDGKKVDSYTVSYLQKLTTLPDIPVKEGYTNGIWCCFGTVFTEETEITQDMSIVAVYDKKSYVIKFNTVGGNVLENINVLHGEQIDGTTVSIARAGYEFVEWQSDGIRFDFSEPVVKDMTLTAVWKIKTYNINIMQNGESLAVIVKKYGDKLSEEELAEAIGMTGAKVYVDENLSLIFDKDKTINGDITLYLSREDSVHNSMLWIFIIGGSVLIAVAVIVVAVLKTKREKKHEK